MILEDGVDVAQEGDISLGHGHIVEVIDDGLVVLINEDDHPAASGTGCGSANEFCETGSIRRGV